MKAGDLVYIPSEVTLLQFNSIEGFDPEKTYIGPSPVKTHKLEKPANLLLTEMTALDKTHIKVWYNGDEWYVNKKDINVL